MTQRVITEEYTLGNCLSLLDLRHNSLDTVTSSLNIKIIPYCVHIEKGINKNNSYSKAKQITNSFYEELIKTGQKKEILVVVVVVVVVAMEPLESRTSEGGNLPLFSKTGIPERCDHPYSAPHSRISHHLALEWR